METRRGKKNEVERRERGKYGKEKKEGKVHENRKR